MFKVVKYDSLHKAEMWINEMSKEWYELVQACATVDRGMAVIYEKKEVEKKQWDDIEVLEV